MQALVYKIYDCARKDRETHIPKMMLSMKFIWICVLNIFMPCTKDGYFIRALAFKAKLNSKMLI